MTSGGAGKLIVTNKRSDNEWIGLENIVLQQGQVIKYIKRLILND